MKKLAVFLLLVLMASLLGSGYLYMTCGLGVKGVEVTATEAESYGELFDYLQHAMQLNAVTGTRFSSDIPGDVENYQFLTFTVELDNKAFIQADQVEIQVSPVAEDMLQLAEETRYSVDARSSGIVQATILTQANAHPVRELFITYYMWGIPMSIRTNSSVSQ